MDIEAGAHLLANDSRELQEYALNLDQVNFKKCVFGLLAHNPIRPNPSVQDRQLVSERKDHSGWGRDGDKTDLENKRTMDKGISNAQLRNFLKIRNVILSTLLCSSVGFRRELLSQPAGFFASNRMRVLRWSLVKVRAKVGLAAVTKWSEKGEVTVWVLLIWHFALNSPRICQSMVDRQLDIEKCQVVAGQVREIACSYRR